MGRSAAKSERYVREFYTALKIASLLVALLQIFCICPPYFSTVTDILMKFVNLYENYKHPNNVSICLIKTHFSEMTGYFLHKIISFGL